MNDKLQGHTPKYAIEVITQYNKCKSKSGDTTRAGKAMCSCMAHTIAKKKFGW